MTAQLLTPNAISDALKRLAPYVHRTPVLESSLLNGWLGHRLLFKAEGMQKIGAFKIRGALNVLLTLKEQGALPGEVVAFSSGNHAQGVALAAKLLGVKATVYMTSFTSPVKVQATRGYGADVVLLPTRKEVEEAAHAHAERGATLIPPFDSDGVIAGQGTACLEAIEDKGVPDAVFASCSGGGLLSGTYLATRLFTPAPPVYGAEPKMANDAAQSLKAGHIVRFTDTPKTVADGATALSISERTFAYLKQLAGIIEVEEETMLYWAQWLSHLLKTPVEPTCAAAMQAACDWLAGQKEKRTVLVILSGGNIAPAMMQLIWERDRLSRIPTVTGS
jgi:threonine dehydratase